MEGQLKDQTFKFEPAVDGKNGASEHCKFAKRVMFSVFLQGLKGTRNKHGTYKLKIVG